MTLAEALLPLLPGAGGVLALVGAGGKTSALFRLGRELRARGRRALLTSTTHLMDPGIPGGLLLRPDLEFPGAGPGVPAGTLLVMARPAAEPGKLKGIHPSQIPALRQDWEFILVEADGARRLPVKAPGPFEPVLPDGTDLVAGLIGLDCLGRPLDTSVAHRPEAFAAVTGCAPGEPIAWRHLEALVRHPEGLFKGARGPRAVLLTKAERAPFRPDPAQCLALEADRVLLCDLAAAEGAIVCYRKDDPWP